MNYFMGIDLGTSSTKTLIMDENGNTAGIEMPVTGYRSRRFLMRNRIRWNGGRLLKSPFKKLCRRPGSRAGT